MSTPESRAVRLLRFNSDVLAQALALAVAHDEPGAPPYERPVGSHLRHVIEHFEALLKPLEPGVVDYDARPRDRALEQSPAIAQQRLRVLLRSLQGPLAASLDAELCVRGRCGLWGESGFEVVSTLGRELVFAASHAVHHYAMLMQHCQDHRLDIPPQFGKAPATVAHELTLDVMNATAKPTKDHLNQEPSCKPRHFTP
jgi:hypothetical protein